MDLRAKLTVAWDCDGTLVSGADAGSPPRHEVLALYQLLRAFGATMLIWSGQGIAHAEAVRAQLGLEDARVVPKGSVIPDLAVDDLDRDLGKVNLYV